LVVAARVAVVAGEDLPRVVEGARLDDVVADPQRVVVPGIREDASRRNHRAGVAGGEDLADLLDLRIP
jgi:hypothetical protein